MAHDIENTVHPYDFTIPAGENLPGGGRSEVGQRFIGTGMSLRDWFAGQALVGELSAWAGMDTSLSADMVADRAYQVADAMLAARKGDAA